MLLLGIIEQKFQSVASAKLHFYTTRSTGMQLISSYANDFCDKYECHVGHGP